jgi:hypothetical protein
MPYTYQSQGSSSLGAVARRGIPLPKNKQQIPGLSFQQSTLKTATGTAPFAVEGHPALNHKHKEEESTHWIVVQQTNAIVCGELGP